jgi:hypothetical protein
MPGEMEISWRNGDIFFLEKPTHRLFLSQYAVFEHLK